MLQQRCFMLARWTNEYYSGYHWQNAKKEDCKKSYFATEGDVQFPNL